LAATGAGEVAGAPRAVMPACQASGDREARRTRAPARSPVRLGPWCRP